MEKQSIMNEKRANPSEDKEPEPLIPCKVCGSLVFQRYVEVHSLKICRKKNPKVFGYEKKHSQQNSHSPSSNTTTNANTTTTTTTTTTTNSSTTTTNNNAASSTVSTTSNSM